MAVAKSLEDLILINKMNEQADPTFSAFQSFANGIAQGMEEKRQAQIKKKQEEDEFNTQLERFNKLNASNAGKLGTLIPSAEMKDGKLVVNAKMVTPQDELKVKREERLTNQMEFSNLNSVRNRFLNQEVVKDYLKIAPNLRSMQSIINSLENNPDQNLIGYQQAMITMFNKITDPASVVRESEYARTPENTPLVNRMIGAIQKIKQGGAGITNDDMKALFKAAEIIGNERGDQYNAARQAEYDYALQTGLDPDKALAGYGLAERYGKDVNIDVTSNMQTNDGQVLEEGTTRKTKKGVTYKIIGK